MSDEDITSYHQFLSKGGRSGKLMRLMDWQKSPLGFPEVWPANLKTAVSVCLNSRLPIMIWWGEQFALLYNDACLNILGSKHPEAMGRPGYEVWPEVWDKLGATLKSVFETGDANSSEDQLLILNRNGHAEEAYFTLSHCAIQNEKGEVNGILTTVSERTQIVLERRLIKTLRNLNKALIGSKTSAEVYQRAATVFHENQFDFPFTLFYKIEDDGFAVRVGSSGESLSENIAPERMNIEGPGSVWPINRALQAEHYLLVEHISEFIGRLPSGKWQLPPDKVVLFPLRVNTRSIPQAMLIIGISPYGLLDETHINFFQLIAEQITDCLGAVEDQNESIKHAHAQSAKADQELEHLRYISSHDLQEPLRKIRTFADFLHRQWDNQPEGKKYLEKIDDSAAQMSVLIQDILNYANLSKQNGDIENVDLMLALETAMQELKPIIREKQAVISYDKLPTIVGMHKQLVQLFKNLLENSLKFSESKPVIEIKSRRLTHHLNKASKDFIEITFTDNGIGFDQRYADKAFLIFQRLHPKKFSGNGMGLTLARKIVENHGGDIHVHSEVNKGTVVTVTLPLKERIENIKAQPKSE